MPAILPPASRQLSSGDVRARRAIGHLEGGVMALGAAKLVMMRRKDPFPQDRDPSPRIVRPCSSRNRNAGQAASTSTCLNLTPSLGGSATFSLGRVRVSSPFSSEAFAASALTAVGSQKLRLNEPWISSLWT